MKLAYLLLLLNLACGLKLPRYKQPRQRLPHSHYEGDARFRKIGSLVSPVTYYHINVLFDVHSTATDIITIGAIDWKPQLRQKVVSGKGEFTLTDPDKTHQKKQERLDALVHQVVSGPTERLNQARKDLHATLRLGDVEERSILAALLGGAIVGFGSALFLAPDVHKVQEQVRQQNGMITSLAHGQEEILRMLNDTEIRHTSQLTALLRARELARLITEQALHLERLATAVYDLRQGKLHPALLTPSTVTEIREKISNFTKLHDLQEVLDPVKEIFRTPITYVITTHGWLITLHIPLVRDRKVMVRELHKLMSAVLTEKQRSNVTHLNLLTSQNYLSIAPDGLLHDVHSHEELSLCQKIDQVYLCQEDTVLYKQPHTCASYLFYKNTERALETCDRQDLDADGVLIEMDRRDFLLSSQDTSTLSCGKGERVFVHPNGTQKVHLEPNCHLSSTEVEIHSANATIGEETLVQHYHVNTTRRSYHGFEELSEHYSAFNEQVAAIKARDEDVLGKARTLGDHLDATLGNHGWAAPVLLIIITVVAMILIRRLCNRRRHRTPVPTDEETPARRPATRHRRRRSRSTGSSTSTAQLARRLSFMFRPSCVRRQNNDNEGDDEASNPIVKSSAVPAASRRVGGDCQGPTPQIVPGQTTATADPGSSLNKADAKVVSAASASTSKEEEGQEKARGEKPQSSSSAKVSKAAKPRQLLVEQHGISTPATPAAPLSLAPSAPIDSEDE